MKTTESVLELTYDQILEDYAPIHFHQANDLISKLIYEELEWMYECFSIEIQLQLENTVFAKRFYNPEDFDCRGEEGIILNKNNSLDIETVVKVVSEYLANKNDEFSIKLIEKAKYINDLLCRGYSYEMFGTEDTIILDALPDKDFFYAPDPYEGWLGETELEPLVTLLRVMPIHIQKTFYLEEAERLWIEAALDYIQFPSRNEINRYGYTNKSFRIENDSEYTNFCVFYVDLDMNFWGMPTSCLLGKTPPVFHLIDRADLINVHEAIASWLEQCSKDLSEIVNYFFQQLHEEIQKIDQNIIDQFNQLIYTDNYLNNHDLIFIYDIEDDNIVDIIKMD